MSEKQKPYGFEEDAIYKVEVLEHKRWVTHGKGVLTLCRAKNFVKVMETATNSSRMKKRLPNGVWFGACMASDHLAFAKAVVRYLEKRGGTKQP